MEECNEINTVFMPASATSALQPVDWAVISIFKFYHLRNTFHKATAAQILNLWWIWAKKIENLEKILEPIKNIRGSQEEVKISTLIGVWKSCPNLMDDFEGIKTLV